VEISQYMLVLMGYLVVAWVLRREKHVKVDVLVNVLSESRRALIHFITSTLNTAVCLIIAAAAFKSTWGLYKAGYFEPTILMIPKFIFIGIIAFGCTMLSIQFWRRTLGFYKKWRTGDPKAA
jgi:TRAP-type C4-dicarboxylate transport system permease small subunit